MKLECKVASPPVCERGDVPTRWQFVIRFDTESVEKPTFALLQRCIGAPFSCKASVTWRPYQSQNPSRCLLPHLTPPPTPPTCTQPFFCATVHAFPVQCKLYSSEYLHQGATTLWVPLQQWEPFSEHPALHCFPLRARRQAFLSTHSIRPLSFCRDSLWKAKVSVMRWGIKAKAMPTLASPVKPWWWNSSAFPEEMVVFGTLTNGMLSGLNSGEITYTETHSSYYIQHIWNQADSSERYSNGSTGFRCKFPQVPSLCSLLFPCKLVLPSQREVACQRLQQCWGLFSTVLQRDDRYVFSWAAEQCREQSRTESQVVSLSKTDPSWYWNAYVVLTEAKFVHCQELGRIVTHS